MQPLESSLTVRGPVANWLTSANFHRFPLISTFLNTCYFHLQCVGQDFWRYQNRSKIHLFETIASELNLAFDLFKADVSGSRHVMIVKRLSSSDQANPNICDHLEGLAPLQSRNTKKESEQTWWTCAIAALWLNFADFCRLILQTFLKKRSWWTT